MKGVYKIRRCVIGLSLPTHEEDYISSSVLLDRIRALAQEEANEVVSIDQMQVMKMALSALRAQISDKLPNFVERDDSGPKHYAGLLRANLAGDLHLKPWQRLNLSYFMETGKDYSSIFTDDAINWSLFFQVLDAIFRRGATSLDGLGRCLGYKVGRTWSDRKVRKTLRIHALNLAKAGYLGGLENRHGYDRSDFVFHLISDSKWAEGLLTELFLPLRRYSCAIERDPGSHEELRRKLDNGFSDLEYKNLVVFTPDDHFYQALERHLSEGCSLRRPGWGYVVKRAPVEGDFEPDVWLYDERETRRVPEVRIGTKRRTLVIYASVDLARYIRRTNRFNSVAIPPNYEGVCPFPRILLNAIRDVAFGKNHHPRLYTS